MTSHVSSFLSLALASTLLVAGPAFAAPDDACVPTRATFAPGRFIDLPGPRGPGITPLFRMKPATTCAPSPDGRPPTGIPRPRITMTAPNRAARACAPSLRSGRRISVGTTPAGTTNARLLPRPRITMTVPNRAARACAPSLRSGRRISVGTTPAGTTNVRRLPRPRIAMAVPNRAARTCAPSPRSGRRISVGTPPAGTTNARLLPCPRIAMTVPNRAARTCAPSPRLTPAGPTGPLPTPSPSVTSA